MATAHPGLLYTSLALLALGILIFIAAVAGVLFGKATPATDIGLYSTTVVFLGFGVGGLLLRAAKIRQGANAAF
jgi:hypothetical protein